MVFSEFFLSRLLTQGQLISKAIIIDINIIIIIIFLINHIYTLYPISQNKLYKKTIWYKI